MTWEHISEPLTRALDTCARNYRKGPTTMAWTDEEMKIRQEVKRLHDERESLLNEINKRHDAFEKSLEPLWAKHNAADDAMNNVLGEKYHWMSRAMADDGLPLIVREPQETLDLEDVA